MANTINSYSGSGAASVTSSRSTQASRENNSAATTSENSQSGAGNAEVQITSTAASLASLGQRISTLPDINQNRVAQISQALANGTYSISAERIASGLLQSDQGLAQIGL
jgi:negative regulator of flagellin synthesis FlgM